MKALRALRAIWKVRGEILHVACIVGGWALLTWGIADIIGWWGLKAWPLSGGLFFLSVAGWGHLRKLFGAGLYALMASKRRRNA